jgi:hypothetical protein
MGQQMVPLIDNFDDDDDGNDYLKVFYDVRDHIASNGMMIDE